SQTKTTPDQYHIPIDKTKRTIAHELVGHALFLRDAYQDYQEGPEGATGLVFLRPPALTTPQNLYGAAARHGGVWFDESSMGQPRALEASAFDPREAILIDRMLGSYAATPVTTFRQLTQRPEEPIRRGFRPTHGQLAAMKAGAAATGTTPQSLP